jgi:hypothetical protein
MSDRAIRQALRRRYRGHEGRLVRKRSRELHRAGERNIRELTAQQRPVGERALITYEMPGAETGASELFDSYFARQLGRTTVA